MLEAWACLSESQRRELAQLQVVQEKNEKTNMSKRVMTGSMCMDVWRWSAWTILFVLLRLALRASVQVLLSVAEGEDKARTFGTLSLSGRHIIKQIPDRSNPQAPICCRYIAYLSISLILYLAGPSLRVGSLGKILTMHQDNFCASKTSDAASFMALEKLTTHHWLCCSYSTS